ncbi:Nucleoside-diphosphate-sugar epimerase [Selenomonas ruminantium]|uniref:Nucleoside-diphosphate-sugar epimerase n=2 Tax=Selenomonas ruminantium TaxID=971 RepID=A0A1I0YGR3_SELRU|nr:Nucleoside-diphosphate-sugar epimerase [Selenomonas ruminantium]
MRTLLSIKRALVTGGTGVTGNALVRYLLSQGIETIALVRPNSSRLQSLPENPLLTIIPCGLDDYPNRASKIKRPIDVFFHLAWDGSLGKEKIDNRYNCYLQNKNVEYSLQAVDLCKALECPVFVMTGSQGEYGHKDAPIVEQMEKKPENAYGMAKLCAEQMTRLMCKKYGIKHIWPILFSIYGPFDGANSLVDMTMKGLQRNQVIPYTKGEQMWDYLYSYDAARALLLLAQRGGDGESYNVAFGKPIRLSECINIIYECYGYEKRPVLGEIPYAANQLMRLEANIDKLIRDTGFRPEYDFRSGILDIMSKQENYNGA